MATDCERGIIASSQLIAEHTHDIMRYENEILAMRLPSLHVVPRTEAEDRTAMAAVSGVAAGAAMLGALQCLSERRPERAMGWIAGGIGAVYLTRAITGAAMRVLRWNPKPECTASDPRLMLESLTTRREGLLRFGAAI